MDLTAAAATTIVKGLDIIYLGKLINLSVRLLGCTHVWNNIELLWLVYPTVFVLMMSWCATESHCFSLSSISFLHRAYHKTI